MQPILAYNENSLPASSLGEQLHLATQFNPKNTDDCILICLHPLCRSLPIKDPIILK